MEEKIAVRVETKKDTMAVQENEFRRGKRWAHGEKELIPVRYGELCINVSLNDLWHADPEFYESHGYGIISVTEYLKRFGTKKDKYVIKIKDRDKFDFDRVVREVREDDSNAVGFILTRSGYQMGVIILYCDFVESFKSGEAAVNSRYLSVAWGRQVVPNCIDMTIRGCKHVVDLPLQCREINVNAIPEAIKDIKAAKKSLESPEIKINVRIL